MTKTNPKYEAFAKALDAAHAAATAAQSGMVENPHAFDCGFAWVITTHRSFAMWCQRQIKERIEENKKNPTGEAKTKHHRETARYGSKHYGAAGWQFWCPGGAPVQAVSIHEAGAKAFAETLSRLGIPAEWSARLD